MNSCKLRMLCAPLLLLIAMAVRADSGASTNDDQSSQPSAYDHMDWDHNPDWPDDHFQRSKRGKDVFSIGHDSLLPKGESARSVVSILGTATNEGDARQVVSVLGNTRTTGNVSRDAVALLGDTVVDGKVEGNAIAVGGSIELGPHAEIDGKVVSLFGSVRRDPSAIVHGGTNTLFGGEVGSMSWLHVWVHHCLFYLRPLAVQPGLEWAWVLAMGFLAFYACLALLFREGVNDCVRTFESAPGHSVLAALIAVLLTPVLITILCVTIIGIAVIPFVVAAFVCAGLFGKAVMLAWVGGRITGRPTAGFLSHPAAAVLVGGFVVTLCYLVPVLGFLVYKLLGFLGFGVVIYRLILAARARQATSGMAGTAHATAPVGESTTAADGAASTAGTADFSATPSRSPIPPPMLTDLPRAGFWVRMAALLVDLLLTGFTLSLLHSVLHFHLVVLAAYGAIMWKMRGSTVGGLVFDLRVVRADGLPMQWETAIVRALGCFLSLAVAGLGFIWIAFDSAHQAWHDKIAGTIVVKVPKGSPY